jgi:hypothetical protein
MKNGLPVKGSIKVITGKQTPGQPSLPNTTGKSMGGSITNLSHSLSGVSANQNGGGSKR